MKNAVFSDIKTHFIPHRILSTLMMGAIRSSETSVLTRATLLHIPEDGIPYSHHRESLKSYITLTILAL
jgi:hypothetical protein